MSESSRSERLDSVAAEANASPRCSTVRGAIAIAVGLLLVACGDAPTATFVAPPEILSVVEPVAGVTMARSLVVELDEPGLVSVEYSRAGGPVLRIDSEAIASRHELNLLRLRAGEEYAVSVVASIPGGEDGPAQTMTVRTDTLPTALAAFQFDAVGDATFPLTMLEISLPNTAGMPVIVDSDGHIVWYREDSVERIHGVGPLPNGAGFAISTQDGVSIVGPAGATNARLTEADAAARTGLGAFEIHHDVVAYGPTGVLLLVEDPAILPDTVWTGEAIWSWDYVSDELDKRWSSHDWWTPDVHRGARTRPADWLHANSLSIGPRGNVLVSFFWTHEVVSIASDFASLEWSLGGPASTFVVADGAMDAGQHTAAEVAPDRVLLFDNGLDRPGGAFFSRAIELELDRGAGTAEIAWEFRPTPDIYAPIVSSARRLSNGNTVVGFGTPPNFGVHPSTGPVSVHEVSSSGDVVWTLTVGGADLMYRATPLQAIGTEYELLGGS